MIKKIQINDKNGNVLHPETNTEVVKYKNKNLTSEIDNIKTEVNNKANSSHTHTKSQITDMPTKLSQFANDKNFITINDIDDTPHENRNILDTITQALIDKWNSAYSHISDTVKHITSAERNLWNTVSNKAEKNHNHDDRYYTEDEINSKLGSKLNSNANAVSASKLATARTIALGDNLTGSANFDGSGNITINGRLSRTNLTGSTTDLNTLNNSDGISSKRYIETTTGGCANISNVPVKEPFTLDVESVRYVNSTDYITKQTFISATTKITYERFCINGTWSGWSQVYTSINKPNKSDVGLSNVDNTRDLDKPISTATQNALNGKANSNHNHDDRYYTESEIDGKVSTLNSSISGKVSPTGTIVANRVPIFSDTTGKVIKDSGFTIAASVPSGAKFTDTNTWRGVQDNLTSTLTDQSLSANQGKVLKGLIDGKANSNHTHDDRYYTENEIDNKLGGKVPTSSNSSITVQADADSSSTSEYISLRAGGNELKIISSAGGSSPAKTNNVFYNGNALYHTGHKPSKGDVGLGNVDNTSDLNKPISTATQNALNGKANTSHTHTKAQITDMPTTMKNPNALTVQFNGTTNKTYDGGSAQTVNITPSAIGAATNNHTHNYAGSSSAGGSANSAVKLATARTIALTGNVTGSANFDGSGNITINTSGISAIPTNTVSALFN